MLHPNRVRARHLAMGFGAIIASVLLVPSPGRAQSFHDGYGGYGSRDGYGGHDEGFRGPREGYGPGPGYGFHGGPGFRGDPNYRYGAIGPSLAIGRVAGGYYPGAYYVPRPYVVAPPAVYLPPPVYVAPPRISYVVPAPALRHIHRAPVHHVAVAARSCTCMQLPMGRPVALPPASFAPAPPAPSLASPAPASPRPPAPAVTAPAPTPAPQHQDYPPDSFQPRPSPGD